MPVFYISTCVDARLERADPEEVKEAMAEGVKFRYLSAPTEILGEAGKVTDIKLEIMERGKPDEKGRRKPVGTGKFETLPIDTVMSTPGRHSPWDVTAEYTALSILSLFTKL